MPRFYFDVYDGEAEFRDGDGIDLAPDDVPGEAQGLLHLLAYARVPYGKRLLLVADVRNAAGRVVYQATAELRPA